MNLHLRNILKISDANITLNGLTVITGENDSGKSTIGKMLFSILKTIGRSRTYRRETVIRNVKMRFRRIIMRIEDDPAVGSPRILDWLTEGLDKICADLADGMSNIDTIRNDIMATLTQSKCSPRTISLTVAELSAIDRQIETVINRDAAIIREFDRLCRNEFNDNITSFGKNDSLVELSSPGGKNYNFSVTIKDNKIDSCQFIDGEFFNDVTYVESPLFLNILNQIGRVSMYRFSAPRTYNDMPMHLTDFAGKMSYLSSSTTEFSLFTEIHEKLLSEIEQIMGGRFESKEKDHTIVYVKEGCPIKLGNVASGIKSFGVIQSLLQTEVISPENLLIWDEPENHLHPRWQVQFARIIILLVKSGIPITISTHSPYFVQGIRYFSALYGVEDVVNYYMAVENDGTSHFKDVSGNLNDVFSKLAGPLNDIMNVDEARIAGIQNDTTAYESK